MIGIDTGEAEGDATPQRDQTSAALIRLVRRAFERRGLSSGPAPGVGARAPLGDKRALLEAGLERLGVDALLAVGDELRHVPWDPVLAVLRRARSPSDALERWFRLEQYYHSRHRTRVVEDEGRAVVLEHFALRGPPPTAAEHLLIAGLVAGLLVDAGTLGLTAVLGGDVCFLVEGERREASAMPAHPERLSLSWSGFRPPAADDAPNTKPDDSLRGRLAGVIAEDPHRRWKVDDAARALGSSTRTLQRALAREGHAFRSVLRTTRCEVAARLLGDGHPVADVGYACGFADQAHFTREFSELVGPTPGAYRSQDG